MKNSKSLKSQFEQLVDAAPVPNINLVAETIELAHLATVVGGMDGGWDGGGGGEAGMRQEIAAYHR